MWQSRGTSISTLSIHFAYILPLARCGLVSDSPRPLATCRGTKVLTGSSMGILSVWDRSKGFGDCVDRIPG